MFNICVYMKYFHLNGLDCFWKQSEGQQYSECEYLYKENSL